MSAWGRPLSPLQRLLGLLLGVLLLSSTCLGPVRAAQQEPRIMTTQLDHLPAGLFYFDDSPVVMLHDHHRGKLLRSPDAGVSWAPIAGVPEGEARLFWQHPYDSNRAYVLSAGRKHWYSHDRGATWTAWEASASPSPWREQLIFHGSDPDKIIYQAEACKSFFECDEVAMHTTDGFRTEPKLLRSASRGCSFARASELFTTGEATLDERRIVCIVRGRNSPWMKDTRVVYSDNYFEDETEPELAPGRTVKGIVRMATVKKFMVMAARAERTDEMALYVTDDTKTWHQAEFPAHKVEEGAYTILESTNYSIQVDVMNTKPSSAMGVLFTSNSNGTYFTRNIEHTNRNQDGHVDFEKVQGIQGIALVNTVKNWEYVEERGYQSKQIESRISFDDGRTFQGLRTKDGDTLQLHSVTDQRNAGRIFTSPAPGIVMGVGNTGPYLKDYKDGDLYVSDDAGATWWKGRDDAHKYEFGDQGSILVAVYDEGPTDEIIYSTDHGHEWTAFNLGEKVRARLLTTTPDSTGLSFLLVGSKEGAEPAEHFVFAIDFEGLSARKCDERDFEKWYARVDEDGEAGCLMGHKQYFRRRKADASCFIKDEFADPQPQFEECECADADFECDYNFVRDGKDCVPAGPLVVPAGQCRKGEESFMGSSGFRLIPGDDCKRTGGAQKDAEVERPCKESAAKPPADGKTRHAMSHIKGDQVADFFYLERTETSAGDDETILMRTDRGQIFITRNHGETWEELKDAFGGDKITGMRHHPHFNDMVFFTTESLKVWYTTNRAETFDWFEAPMDANRQGLPALRLHPTNKNWMIWTGAVECGDGKGSCHSLASYSTDRGDHWETLLRYVGRCQFIPEEGRGRSTDMRDQAKREQLVYCEQYARENPHNELQLVASDTFFKEHKVQFDNVVRFATVSEFIVVAAKEKDSMKAAVSVDGWTFADALFPPDFDFPKQQQAYTVLPSSTHAVFLHVTVSGEQDAEYGPIIKSNSNGTSYVLALPHVNRDRNGYVDFEKVHGLEGVAVANVVDNVANVRETRQKKLKTVITHNDGAEWDHLPPPKEDAKGKRYECDGGLEKCSLHLHGYTERRGGRAAYSSQAAVGLMFGVGNVGPHLKGRKDSDTFMTRDGGISWVLAQEGEYMWGFGDQGSILVLAKVAEPTDVVLYSLDEGRKWEELRFTEGKFRIDALTTAPSDNSRKFLLWGLDMDDKESLTTVALDFSGITDVPCRLDEEDPAAGDYDLWQPKHPAQDNHCLFGHVEEYHRKRPEAVCYNGRRALHVHSIARNCSCTRQDFECDYNYVRQTDGSCGLVPGLAPKDHSEICRQDPDTVAWYEPTGYRRIPLSTCSGGHELEYLEDRAHACPGHEQEFGQAHRGISGAGLFFAIVIPIAAASAAGWWVWRNWDGKFGRIRLGEAGGSVFDAGSPWIQYPVMAVAVVVAVLAAVPDVAGRVWRFGAKRLGVARGSAGGGLGGVGRYTTRGSFARGRSDYAVVDADEGELLGEDSDEEV
ncbi:MAG: vacuolar protein sorting/targeting protein PEP1 [Thelocarpon impressellum]|nr:MAG: vacuolar protein sorting/targeting protein PEP1 [Thelocarpon impressellum]